jgi:hypothetical protein
MLHQTEEEEDVVLVEVAVEDVVEAEVAEEEGETEEEVMNRLVIGIL